MFDYENEDLVREAIEACNKLGTLFGQCDFVEVLSRPGSLISYYDSEGNKTESHLAFTILIKMNDFTIEMKVAPDGWFRNDSPPALIKKGEEWEAKKFIK